MQLLDLMVKYWPIEVALVGAIGWLSKLQIDMISLKARQEHMEESIEKQGAQLNSLTSDFREVKTDIRWIRETLEQMRKK